MKKTQKVVKEDPSLKMACLEQSVKLGGNGEQAVTNAQAFYVWMTTEHKEPEAPVA